LWQPVSHLDLRPRGDLGRPRPAQDQARIDALPERDRTVSAAIRSHARREVPTASIAPPGWLLLRRRHGRDNYVCGVPIRVVLAEDNVLLRDGVSRLIGATDDLELAGVCGDLPGLLDLVTRNRPDVVVTDIRMPPTGTDEGIRAAAALRTSHPDIGVVVLSQYANPRYALDLLAGGSERRAYLLKERVSDVDELVVAIRTVDDGGSVIDPKVVEALVATSATRRTSDLDRLTKRETEILQEMATGKSNAAIAAALILSERAVEKHTNSIFSKLGLSEERNLNRRVKAVLLYLSGQPVDDDT
jgi:DNA-binding NarL/FixJ family response regulator